MADRIFKYDKHQATTMGWHGKTDVVSKLDLDNNWLTTFDIVPYPLNFEDGTPADFSLLRCSDVKELRIGVPYNPLTFKPISNKDFLGLIKASIGGTSHEVCSVGSVRNRGRVFVSIKLNGMETFKAAGRTFSAFLNFGNGHDKSSVLWVNSSNICTVCDNTFSFNLFSVEGDSAQGAASQTTDDIKVALRHTKNATLRLPAIADLVDKAVGVQGEFKAAMDTLAAVPVTKPQALFAGFLGRKVAEKDIAKGMSTRGLNTSLRLVELFKTGKGNLGQNRADAFQAVTDYYSHESSKGEDVFKQVLSSDFGAGNVAKVEFWDMINDDDKVDATIIRGLELITNTKD